MRTIIRLLLRQGIACGVYIAIINIVENNEWIGLDRKQVGWDRGTKGCKSHSSTRMLLSLSMSEKKI